ncbi:MAG: hypothetical protein GY925_26325 [Actinomycetia bacterium]|nr:hypothetical protein [Actinomycetes bacterium]
MGEPTRHGVTRSQLVAWCAATGQGYKAAARHFWGHLQESDSAEYRRCVACSQRWARWRGKGSAEAPATPTPQPAQRPEPPAPPPSRADPGFDPTTATPEEYLAHRILTIDDDMDRARTLRHTGTLATLGSQQRGLVAELAALRAARAVSVDPLDEMEDQELLELLCEIVARLPPQHVERIAETCDARMTGKILQWNPEVEGAAKDAAEP